MDLSLSLYDLLQIQLHNEETLFIWSGDSIQGKVDWNTVSRMLLTLLQKGALSDMELEHGQMQKHEMLEELKQRSLQDWLQIKPVAQVDTIDSQKSLFEGCVQMQDSNSNKIAITCQDTQVVLGELSYRDVLLFIVRNLQSQEGQNETVH